MYFCSVAFLFLDKTFNFLDELNVGYLRQFAICTNYLSVNSSTPKFSTLAEQTMYQGFTSCGVLSSGNTIFDYFVVFKPKPFVCTLNGRTSFSSRICVHNMNKNVGPWAMPISYFLWDKVVVSVIFHEKILIKSKYEFDWPKNLQWKALRLDW